MTARRMRGVGSRGLLALAVAMTLGPGVLSAQAPPVFELVEDLRIGAIDEPDYNLESPGHLIVGSDGSIYVTEPNRGEVLVYDEGGRFVRRIGGRGEGPGEFRSTAGGIGWSGNELWVVDPFLVRITFFSASGELLRTSRYGLEGMPVSEAPRIRGVLPGGVLLAQLPEANLVVRSELEEQQALVRISDPEEAPRRIAQLRQVVSPPRITVPSPRGPTPVRVRVIRNADLVGVAPDGSRVVIVRPAWTGERIDGTTIEVLGPDGSEERRWRVPLSPLPVSPEDQAAIHSEFAEAILSLGLSLSAATRLARELYPVPDFQFPVGSVYVGAEDVVWLGHHDRPGAPRTASIHDLASGLHLGEVRVPERPLRVLAVGRDYIWTLERDELRVAFLVRYRTREIARSDW